MRTDFSFFFFMYFYIKKYIGTQGEACRQLTIILNPSVVYATDRSKAVVPVFFFFFFFVFFSVFFVCVCV